MEVKLLDFMEGMHFKNINLTVAETWEQMSAMSAIDYLLVNDEANEKRKDCDRTKKRQHLQQGCKETEKEQSIREATMKRDSKHCKS